MGRLRFCGFQRRALIVLGAFAAFNLFIISEFIQPRRLALSLDLVYDPPQPSTEQDPAQAPFLANGTRPRVLLVSALLPLTDHTIPYDLSGPTAGFLGRLDTDIYLYTTQDIAPVAQLARARNRILITDTTFASPFDVPPLRGRRKVYEQIQKLDTSPHSSAELYALRNAKAFFLQHAAQKMAQSDHYDYVFWVDFDALPAEHSYASWPDTTRLERIWKEGAALASRRQEDLMFFPISAKLPKDIENWTEDLGPIDTLFAEGSFFGGSPSAIDWFTPTFYVYHNYYLSLGFFIGHDTAMYNTLLLLFPSRFLTVWASDPTAPARGGLPPSFLAHGPLGSCGAFVKYYQWWLSDRTTRETMSDWWMTHVAEDDSEAVGWWKVWVRCRLTRVLSMSDALRTMFGRQWSPSVTMIRRALH